MTSASTASWLEETSAALRLAEDATTAQDEADRLEDAWKSLKEIADELSEVVEASQIVRPLGWGGRTATPQVLRDLSLASESLDPRALTRLSRDLRDYSRETRQAVVTAWSNHANARLGSVADLTALATVLRAADGVAQMSVDLERALGDLARQQRGLPTLESARLLDYAESVLGELEAALEPPSVREFLSATSRGGASIQLLTPDVVEWLRAHRALNRFRIAPGTPSDVPHA